MRMRHRLPIAKNIVRGLITIDIGSMRKRVIYYVQQSQKSSFPLRLPQLPLLNREETPRARLDRCFLGVFAQSADIKRIK